MIKRSWFLVLTILVWLVGPSWANAVPKRPMETLEAPINQIIGVLNDPDYRDPTKKKLQRDKIWKIARPVFDFDKISQRVIGKPWKNFTADEKRRFSSLFSEYLGNKYIDKLQGEYHNEKIDFENERVKGKYALVRTRLHREGAAVPISYLMLQVDGTWKIIDVLVENDVSIMRIYQADFYNILKEHTPAQLIDQLEKKLDTQN
jgi:phospholipid transport system substrate-binding protein